MKDEESLETSEVISQLPDTVKNQVDNLLADGVLPPGGVLLTSDHLLGVEELSVGSGSHLVDNGWLKIKEDGSWDVLASTGLGEEGVESIITTTDGFVGWHLTIWLDSVLKAEELPAGVANLDACLSEVDADDLTHCAEKLFQGSRG